ncbi:MAG: ABC transporter substrate-binding protein [Clostridia bacterium]|nr:ABC transporter substrate-binding protein [Clostridia bacterium]
MKRIFAMLMVCTLVIGLLGGCGDSGKTAGGKYEIDWYYVGEQFADEKAVEEAVNAYLEGKLDVTLNLHPLDWSGITEKINVMAGGGEKFDITYTSITNYNALASKNALMPLNDLLDKYGQGIKDALGEHFLEGSKLNGTNYALPVNKEHGHHYGILYQVDVAEKLGITEQIDNIKSLDDLDPILDIVKEKAPELVPFRSPKGCDDTYMLDFEHIAYPAAFYADSTDGKVVNYVDTPEFMEAAKKIHARFEKGYLLPGGTQTQATETFFAYSYLLKPGLDKEQSTKLDWKQVDLTPPRMQSSDTMGAMLAISKTSENPELVMQFLNMCYTDSNLLNLIVYGIEGKHYTKIDDNTIKLIENSGYGNVSMRWEFCDIFKQYLTEKDDPARNEQFAEYNKIMTPSNYLGFNPDISSLSTQVGACANVRAEFEQQIADGNSDAEELVTKYREKLKLAGAEDIVKEVQRQYDEWAKTNKK